MYDPRRDLAVAWLFGAWRSVSEHREFAGRNACCAHAFEFPPSRAAGVDGHTVRGGHGDRRGNRRADRTAIRLSPGMTLWGVAPRKNSRSSIRSARCPPNTRAGCWSAREKGAASSWRKPGTARDRDGLPHADSHVDRVRSAAAHATQRRSAKQWSISRRPRSARRLHKASA